VTANVLGPPRLSHFTTTDPDVAHEFVCRNYTDRTVRMHGPRNGFRMQHVQITDDEVTVATGSHSTGVEFECEPLGGLLVARVLAGRIERETAGVSVRYRPGDVFVVARPEDRYFARWDSSVRSQVAWVDPGLLAEVAAEDGEPAAVRFTGLDAVSPVSARHWRTTVDYVMTSLLTAVNRPDSRLVVGSAARLLAAATLSTFPNTAVGLEASRRPPTTPALLRRVIALMEDRAHEDLSVFELAAAARVSPAEIREAFRRHLATTPGAYLRQIRLDRVHEQLLYPDRVDDVLVPAVARRWGFADLDAFTSAYRDAYGRSPDETLVSVHRR
jgi:AraC-like DNA-binding protein